MSERIADIEWENEEQRAELERLRAELAKIRKASERQNKVQRFVTSSAVRVLVSGELVDSIHKWLEAKRLGDPAPPEETAEMVAAMFKRVVNVGLVGAGIAALPMILLAWQNILIQRQIDQQADDMLIVRRAQLLDTIYEQVCEDVPVEVEAPEDEADTDEAEPDGEETAKTRKECTPKAHIRARQEAVQAFVKIEQSRDSRADLRRADLRRANLTNANLTNANLLGADLFDANLTYANLEGANLRGANLIDAGLIHADLSDADLIHADLSDAGLANARLEDADLEDADLEDADLEDADFTNARLFGANLRGANLIDANLINANLTNADLANANLEGAGLTRAYLTYARNLTQDQINKARGDETTKLPAGLTMPDHWKGDKFKDPADE